MVIEVFDVLERHGYRKASDAASGRAAGILMDMIEAYEARMSGEAVDLVLARAQRELADVRHLRIRLKDRLDEVENMLDALKAERRRDQPPPQPHLYLVQ